MLSLTVSERLALKGRAHSLNPTVIIGNAGLTESVMNEITATLKAHELIKIRVMAERPEREAIMTAICTQLNAAPVQHIGKMLVIYLPNPDGTEKSAATPPKKPSKPKGQRITKRQLGER